MVCLNCYASHPDNMQKKAAKEELTEHELEKRCLPGSIMRQPKPTIFAVFDTMRSLTQW